MQFVIFKQIFLIIIYQIIFINYKVFHDFIYLFKLFLFLSISNGMMMIKSLFPIVLFFLNQNLTRISWIISYLIYH